VVCSANLGFRFQASAIRASRKAKLSQKALLRALCFSEIA
jgi:hypothetical protein